VSASDCVDKATGIAAGREFHLLHSPHASATVNPARHGEVMWGRRLHYADSTTADMRVRFGVETSDWQLPHRLSGASLGWVEMGIGIPCLDLYVVDLRNPGPGENVNPLDIVSANRQASQA
jgi:hypothetical protein